MTNLDRATTIRRTVANKGYDLLKDCKEPETIYDGKYDDRFVQEHWDIDPQKLAQEVAEALPDEWFDKDEEEIWKQIDTLVQSHLDSKYFEADKDHIRRQFYQHWRDQKDWNETKCGLMRA